MATLSEKQVDAGLLVTGVPLVLLARAANIFPLSYLLNMKGEPSFNPTPTSLSGLQYVGMPNYIHVVHACTAQVNPGRLYD